jgi:DNA-binding response OmpR family regulator
MASILIVEDDPSVAEGVSDRLAAEGHEVTVVGEGKAGLQQARAGGIDLIVLDIMLPGGLSGFDVCRTLRQEGNRVLILMLTGKMKDEIDRVRGLDMGADDYMVKPFSVAELQARIRALLRRSQREEQDKALPGVQFGNVEVDFERRIAKVRGEEVHLTPKAFEVLQALVARKGRVLGREALLSEVWGHHLTPETRAIDRVITELRDRLEADARKPRHILTVHGLGYKFLE